MVGCGTIIDVGDAERAVDAGAEFIITPVMLPDVIGWCAERNIVCVPGCQTPTELVSAYRAGAPLQKLFPGVAGGPMWVKVRSCIFISTVKGGVLYWITDSRHSIICH